jgi:hypothetical protein
MNQIINQARNLVSAFGQKAPGAGCWQFIQKHRPDLWQDHTKAIRESDLSKAASTFKAMLTAWQDQKEQGQLFT